MDDELETNEMHNNNNESINNNNNINYSSPQLVMCDELKNLNKEMNSMIPDTLVSL